jgi:hypothetical protein
VRNETPDIQSIAFAILLALRCLRRLGRGAIHAHARNSGDQTGTVQIKSFKIVPIQVVVVALLVFLAGFSTLAKNVQYLPKSNPAHYLSIASKMKADSDCNVAQHKLEPTQPSSRLVIPEGAVPVFTFDPREAPFVQRISLMVCLQYRAPPITHS